MAQDVVFPIGHSGAYSLGWVCAVCVLYYTGIVGSEGLLRGFDVGFCVGVCFVVLFSFVVFCFVLFDIGFFLTFWLSTIVRRLFAFAQHVRLV